MENTSEGNNNNLTSKCEEEQEDMQALAFYLEGIVEIIISIVGLVTNSVAVPLLTRLENLHYYEWNMNKNVYENINVYMKISNDCPQLQTE